MTTRYGTGPAVTEVWSKSGARSVSSGWGPAYGRIGKLQETDHFEARWVADDGEELAATWDVRGLREALAPARAVCSPLPPVGEWERFDVTDPSTGTRKLGVSSWAYATSGLSGSPGRQFARIQIRCTAGNPYDRLWFVVISGMTPTDGRRTVKVTMHYGTGRGVTENLEWLVGGEGIHGPEGVVRKLQETDRFEARVIRADGKALTATWDVRGLQEALVPAREVCSPTRPVGKRSSTTAYAPPTKTATWTPVGRWRFSDRTYASTGTREIGVGMWSSDDSSGRGAQIAYLSVGCILPVRDDPWWDVVIGWYQRVSSGETVAVRTRYGTGPAVTHDWLVPNNKELTVVPASRLHGPEDVISRLLGTDRFEARVIGSDGEELAAVWEVAGLRETLEPVFAVCGVP